MIQNWPVILLYGLLLPALAVTVCYIVTRRLARGHIWYPEWTVSLFSLGILPGIFYMMEARRTIKPIPKLTPGQFSHILATQCTCYRCCCCCCIGLSPCTDTDTDTGTSDNGPLRAGGIESIIASDARDESDSFFASFLYGLRVRQPIRSTIELIADLVSCIAIIATVFQLDPDTNRASNPTVYALVSFASFFMHFGFAMRLFRYNDNARFFGYSKWAECLMVLVSGVQISLIKRWIDSDTQGIETAMYIALIATGVSGLSSLYSFIELVIADYYHCTVNCRPYSAAAIQAEKNAIRELNAHLQHSRSRVPGSSAVMVSDTVHRTLPSQGVEIELDPIDEIDGRSQWSELGGVNDDDDDNDD
jgi:hypothetical protein